MRMLKTWLYISFSTKKKKKEEDKIRTETGKNQDGADFMVNNKRGELRQPSHLVLPLNVFATRWLERGHGIVATSASSPYARRNGPFTMRLPSSALVHFITFMADAIIAVYFATLRGASVPIFKLKSMTFWNFAQNFYAHTFLIYRTLEFTTHNS